MSAGWERVWYPIERPSLGRRLARLWLAIPALAWWVALAVRNVLYRLRLLKVTRIEGALVISVGNLNVGGSGKTPAVIWLAQHLAAHGKKVAVLTRGYGRQSAQELLLNDGSALPSAMEAGDEPLLIANRCPGVAVLVGANRVRLAQRARKELGSTVLLLDDGFQHRRLARDVDIVVVDELAGFGNGHLLPWGPLRETPRALKRATLIWLRTGTGSPAALALPPSIPVVRTAYIPRRAVGPDGRNEDPRVLEGENVFALTGLARPGSFIRTLESLGAQVRAQHLVADHHFYSAAELEMVRTTAEREGLLVVTTEKDRARLPTEMRTWVIPLEVEIIEGRERLDRALGIAGV